MNACTNLTKIHIPATVELIGKECFSNCKTLAEVTFESGSKLRQIGNRAFSNTAIRRIEIPASVITIGHHCFSGCKSLREVTFESGSSLTSLSLTSLTSLKEIGSFAFVETGIMNIDIPSKCEILNGHSLVGIKNITICNGNTFLITEESFVKSHDEKRLIQYFGSNEKIVIDRGIELIEKGCFSGCYCGRKLEQRLMCDVMIHKCVCEFLFQKCNTTTALSLSLTYDSQTQTYSTGNAIRAAQFKVWTLARDTNI
jgi:hypothetical protein